MQVGELDVAKCGRMVFSPPPVVLKLLPLSLGILKPRSLAALPVFLDEGLHVCNVPREDVRFDELIRQDLVEDVGFEFVSGLTGQHGPFLQVSSAVIVLEPFLAEFIVGVIASFSGGCTG